SVRDRSQCRACPVFSEVHPPWQYFFFFKQKTAYEIGLGIPAEPLFRSQGSNVPNPDEAVPSFVSGAMAKAGKGLLEGTLQAGTSAVSDKLLDLVGLGGKSAADKGK